MNFYKKEPIEFICKKTCVFANVRDEKNIKEWVTHHLFLGFDFLVLFDHKSIQPLSQELSCFGNKVIVINVSHLEGGIKMPLMNKAISIAKKIQMDWFIYLDADEFIILHSKFKTIKDFLNVFNFADLIAINWLFFGSSFHRQDPSGGIIKNYTKSEEKLAPLVKCFVRPQRAIHATNPHYYHMMYSNRSFGTNGKPFLSNSPFHTNPISFQQSIIYIAHYVYQSEESFIKRKLHIPRDDNGEYRNDNVNEIHSRYNEVDNYMPISLSNYRLHKKNI
jgi:hypothetical protein